MINQGKLKTSVGILLFALLFLVPKIALSALYHQSTSTVTDNSLSRPVAHYAYKVWLYTKKDSSGYDQIFMQDFPSVASDPTTTLTETQLTSSSFSKSNPQWGDTDVTISYYADSSAAAVDCNGGDLFYYKGDGDANDKDNIYVGCIENLRSATPAVIFSDVKLTGLSRLTAFDVDEFSPTRDDTLQFIDRTGTERQAYGVVFTESTNHTLHLLMHSSARLYGDSTAINRTLVVDYSGAPTMGTFDWSAYASGQTKLYGSPVFDPNGIYIAFLYKESTEDYYDIGTVAFFGTSTTEKKLTDLSREVQHLQFQNPTNVFPYTNIFFEYPDTGTEKGRILALPIGVDWSTYEISSWCSEARLLTDENYSRRGLTFLTTISTKEPIHFAYARTQADDKRDIYRATPYIAVCEDAADPSSGTYGTAAVTTEYTISAIADTSETQLTCLNDNRYPAFLPEYSGAYRNELFEILPSSTVSLTDIIFLSDFSDASGEALINLYDVDNAIDTSTCSSCYENSDGSELVDENTYLDFDGIKDECEENLPCSATFITADLGGDYDSDTIINSEDNCPCSYNPTQMDTDRDGVGDVYGDENGCDNCPSVSNPADMDNNGDGVTGDASDHDSDGDVDRYDYAYGNLDGDVRQTDSDADGYGDACEEVEDECGTNDRDDDGINDYCDNCIYTYNPSQDITDGNDAGDACTTTTVITTIYPCEAGNEDYLYDQDGDGINESCTSSPDYPCEEGNENYLYDTDTDGTKDSCSPCAGDSDYNYDVNGDGVNESCVNLQVTDSPAPVSGGYFLHGSICSLGLGSTPAPGVPAMLLILIGLAPLALQRRLSATTPGQPQRNENKRKKSVGE